MKTLKKAFTGFAHKKTIDGHDIIFKYALDLNDKSLTPLIAFRDAYDYLALNKASEDIKRSFNFCIAKFGYYLWIKDKELFLKDSHIFLPSYVFEMLLRDSSHQAINREQVLFTILSAVYFDIDINICNIKRLQKEEQN